MFHFLFVPFENSTLGDLMLPCLTNRFENLDATQYGLSTFTVLSKLRLLCST
jgi:hypothetical protein